MGDVMDAAHAARDLFATDALSVLLDAKWVNDEQRDEATRAILRARSKRASGRASGRSRTEILAANWFKSARGPQCASAIVGQWRSVRCTRVCSSDARGRPTYVVTNLV